ncbi:DUF2235 domain-containing protein [Yoonia sp.]|uniref:DUF2235 domain-containing protein n=1 Tax=Yoonia sp. TaxID=2212373 RepID=UPI00391DB05C
MQLRDWLFGLFGRKPRTEEAKVRHRGPAIHVIIMDGKMSSLEPGLETNAGLTFKLLREVSQNMTVYYEAGIQWRDWSSTIDVVTGRGISRTIRRAYGVIASRYRPGDKIVLIGYSRGAFAVRSLSGVIGMIGLVRPDHATERNITQAYRHYRLGARSKYAADFRRMHCHDTVEVEAVAVWDTVKALGLRLPFIWRWGEDQHAYHNTELAPHVRHGFHALARDERRRAYAPVLWSCPPGWQGHVEQVWFKGNHADVGGQVRAFPAARPLANIPLVWMLERLESCGLPLPAGWHAQFPQDVNAPSIGNWHGWARLFIARRRRVIGRDPSERLHDSIAQQP